MGNVSFAKNEYLLDLLGVNPGSVTPFALLNNLENSIDFYLEDKLYESEYVNFHPLTNTATITIKCQDFVEFMIENKKKNTYFFIIKRNGYKDIWIVKILLILIRVTLIKRL